MKNTVTEIKNTIGGRLNEAEEQISDLEDKVAENIQTEQRQEKKIQNNEFKGSLGQHQAYQHSHHRGAIR